MSNELIPQQDNHFSRAMTAGGPGMNVGAVAIESERAIAEAQGQLTLAKRFPRSMTAAITEFLESCKSPEFAATAFYSVPNRGSGPSIRFAEEAARCYGNFQYGHRELSRTEGRSEVEVFAWDMQNNNYSKRQITVMHVMDTRNGSRKLTDQADIDNKIANVASKQMRGRILALLPKHMIAAGQEACKRTLAGDGEKSLRDRLIKMAEAFARFGVTDAHLTAYLGHAVDNTTIDELGDLMGVHNAIRDGAKPSEFFKFEDDAKQEAPAAAAITQQVKQSSEQQKPASQAPRGRRTQAQESKPTESESKPAKDPAPESSQKQDSQPPAEQQTQQDTPPADQQQEKPAAQSGVHADLEDDNPF